MAATGVQQGTAPDGGRPRASVDAASPLQFLDALRLEDREAVLDVCRVVEAAPGDRLLAARADAVSIILAGATYTRTSTGDGHTVVTSLVEAGQIGGLTAALGRSGPDIELTAALPSTALLATGRDLRRLMSDRPAIARAVLDAALAQLAAMHGETVRFANTTVSERVVHRILELVARWGRDVDIVVEMPLTQDDLASWSRTSRESTAKTLHALRTRQVIRTGRRQLCVLDVDHLAALVAPVGQQPVRTALRRRRAEDVVPERKAVTTNG